MSYIRNILLWVLNNFLIWRTIIFPPILELYGIFCQIRCGLRMTILVSSCHVFWHTSQSSLSAHAILLVLSWGGSIMSSDVLHELDKELALFCPQLSHLLFSDSIFHQFAFLFSRTPERKSYMEDTWKTCCNYHKTPKNLDAQKLCRNHPKSWTRRLE